MAEAVRNENQASTGRHYHTSTFSLPGVHTAAAGIAAWLFSLRFRDHAIRFVHAVDGPAELNEQYTDATLAGMPPRNRVKPWRFAALGFQPSAPVGWLIGKAKLNVAPCPAPALSAQMRP